MISALSRTNTKRKIIDAATALMARKGFMECSLSEIASEARVKEPTIYQYFKGKEDLLFSASDEHMENFLLFLDEHLQGIMGAFNKLSKLIWVHLYYNDTNSDYMKLLLFECRTNRNFYQSTSYRLMRRYAGILLSILEEGIECGIFRSDINSRLAREVIFGLMDFETITRLATHEISEATQDHPDIMRLLQRMLLRGAERDRPLAKKQSILNAATRAFAEKGYSESTIALISSKASVSEGTVYEYFKNKEDLLLSIPEQRFQEHLSQLAEIFDPKNPLGKLRLFIRNHFEVYLHDPDFLIVFLTQIQYNTRFYQSRAYTGLQKYIQVFEALVQDVIENQENATRINVRIYRNMFLGAFNHMALRWFVAKQKGRVDKMREIITVTTLLTDVLASAEGPDLSTFYT